MHKALSRRRVLAIAICVVLIAAVGLVGGWLGRRKIRAAYNVSRAVIARPSVAGRGDLANVLFVHHSTGHYLIEQGNVRELFLDAGYDFWDHDYNYIGLTRPDGARAGYSYNIPNDNTDPDGYAVIFGQPLRRWPVNTFSAIMQHEVILFKSCFPTSDIASEEQLEAYKAYYRGIRAVIAQHPDHLFVAMTPPPLVPESTTLENALRARAWADWLASDEFAGGVPNLVTWDFFDHLAESDRTAPDYSMLRSSYRPGIEGDSHPNGLANRTVGPQFVAFVVQAIETYRASGG